MILKISVQKCWGHFKEKKNFANDKLFSFNLIFRFIPICSNLFHFIPLYSIIFQFIPFYSSPTMLRLLRTKRTLPMMVLPLFQSLTESKRSPTWTAVEAAGKIFFLNRVSHSELTMVFCYQNCSDLLWEEIVLVIEKSFWNLRLKPENLQTFWDL